MNNQGNLKVYPRVAIKTEDGRWVMCAGVADLLEGIGETGSLYATCRRMQMAYSKGWSILREAQEAYGEPYVTTYGAHGSKLTDVGATMLEKYREMEHRCEEACAGVL